VGALGSTGNIGVNDNGRTEIAVYCENGYVELDQGHGTLLVRRHDGSEERRGPLSGAARYPTFATAQNLVDVILGKAENGSPGAVGTRVVELLEAAYRSAETDGAPVGVAELLAGAPTA